MRIVFVEPHLELYGGIRRVLEFANRLADRGHDVAVYHPSGQPCSWMPCRAEVYPLHDIYLNTANIPADVLVFNNPPQYRVAQRAIAKVKLFYILALYDREQLKRFTIRQWWPRKGRMLSLKRCLQLPFVHVSNATWMQTWLRDNLSLDTELQLGGVNFDYFHPIANARSTETARRLWPNARPDSFRILTSGDPREHKGYREVVAASELLKKQFGHLVWATYHGRQIPQEQMAEAYSAADLFVDAQWYAGWNNPVVEAMACETPVVCSNIGGVADFARHDVTALLVPPREPEPLAAAVAHMVSNEGLRRRLSDAARRKVEMFSWDVAVSDFEALLQRKVAEAK